MRAGHELPVDRLEIRNFRLFREITIPKLAQINLIVGKNNTGKTALLEAIRIYATVGSRETLWDILNSREELDQGYGDNVPPHSARYAMTNLFSRWGATDRLSISTGRRQLTIRFQWFRQISEEEDDYRIEPVENPDELTNPVPVLVVKSNGETKRVRIGRKPPLPSLADSASTGKTDCLHISSFGISPKEAARYWDSIALTPLETEVTNALRMLYPQVDRISMVGDNGKGRTARVKTTDSEKPIPLRSLGDGVNRIFGMALALVNAKAGLLLIDEVENGIHYSAQPDLWSFIIRTAQQLDVQVFATTHSSDCVQAFEIATRKNREVEGLLTRLESKNGSVRVTQFDEEDLHTATREAIEVR